MLECPIPTWPNVKGSCNVPTAHRPLVTFHCTNGCSFIPSSYSCSTFCEWVEGLSKCSCSSLLSHYALLCCYPLHFQLPDVDFKVDKREAETTCWQYHAKQPGCFPKAFHPVSLFLQVPLLPAHSLLQEKQGLQPEGETLFTVVS